MTVPPPADSDGLVGPVAQLNLPSAGSLPIAARRRLRLGRLLKWAAAIAVVVVLWSEVGKIGPYVRRAGSSLSHLNLTWLSVALLAEVASMACFARLQQRMLAAAGARVAIRHMLAMTYVSNAVNATLPAGTALSSVYAFRRLQRWGAGVPAAGFVLIASGLLSTVAFAAIGVADAVDNNAGRLWWVAVGALTCGGIWLLRRRAPEMQPLVRVLEFGVTLTNRLLRRDPDRGQARLSRLLTDLLSIRPRRRDWTVGFAFALGNWLADLTCLVACCRAIGAQDTTMEVAVIAYLAGMAVSTLSMLPGGLGMVDTAMILALSHAGLGVIPATAAVVLYRLISLVGVVAIGWTVWATTFVLELRQQRQMTDARVDRAGAQ